jgi:hypothetical protein
MVSPNTQYNNVHMTMKSSGITMRPIYPSRKIEGLVSPKVRICESWTQKLAIKLNPLRIIYSDLLVEFLLLVPASGPGSSQ